MASQDEETLRLIAENDLRSLFPNARIIHELVIDQGVRRLDLAAVTPDHICLVEIKSKKDVLKRLDDQIRDARVITSDVMIYCDRKHLDDICSKFWNGVAIRGYEDGVTASRGLSEKYDLRHYARRSEAVVRQGNLKMNPRCLFMLLWREEMIQALKRHAIHVPAKGRSRLSMTEAAVENLTGKQIRQTVCEVLRARTFARADPPIDIKPSLPDYASAALF